MSKIEKDNVRFSTLIHEKTYSQINLEKKWNNKINHKFVKI